MKTLPQLWFRKAVYMVLASVKRSWDSLVPGTAGSTPFQPTPQQPHHTQPQPGLSVELMSLVKHT